MKKLFYSLSAVVFAALFMVSCNKNNPKDVADKWLTSFYHMDYEEAKKVSTDETKGLVNTFQELTRSLADSSKQEMKKIQVTIKDVKEEGDKATVTYTTSEEDAKEQKLAMIKKDGKWLVEFSKNDMMGDVDNSTDQPMGSDSTAAPTTTPVEDTAKN